MKTSIHAKRQSCFNLPVSACALLMSGIFAFTMLSLAGCANTQSEESGASSTNETPFVQSINASIEKNGFQSAQAVQYSCAQVPGFDLSELLGRAELVVDGVVEGKSDAFLVEPVDGSLPKFFTDVHFKVDTVYAGTPHYTNESNAQQSLLTVRTEGGSGDMVATINDATPAFDNGQRYLLFLYQVDDGSYYNTEGEHYYVIGIRTGAWMWSEEIGKFESSIAQSDGKESVDNETLLQMIATTPSTIGVEKEDLGINAKLSEIEDEYQEGIVPQALYDEYMQIAQKEASTFARVMTMEEQLAYEQEVMSKTKASESGSLSLQ